MIRPSLRSIRVKAVVPEGVGVEAEFEFERLKEWAGSLVVSLYTVEGPIQGFRYDKMINRLSELARENSCRMERGAPRSVIVCSGVLVLVDARTVGEELGLDLALLASNDDAISDSAIEDLESVAEELGFDPGEIMNLYFSVETLIYLTLDRLKWLEENAGIILSAMDQLEARYKAKIVVGEKPRHMDALRRLERDYEAKAMVLGDYTLIYLQGVHALRDPLFYSTLRKAFARGLFRIIRGR